MILLLAACSGAAPPAPPAPEVPLRTIHVGDVVVTEWEYGSSHTAGVNHRFPNEITYKGVTVEVEGERWFDSVDLPPVAAPQWAVVGAKGGPSAGLRLVNLRTHDVLKVSDAYLGGTYGWSEDAMTYITSARVWDTRTSSGRPFAAGPEQSPVELAPDGSALATSEYKFDIVDGHMKYWVVFRAISLDGNVLDEVVVDPLPSWWAASTGFPWPATGNERVLWQARHLDWDQREGRWHLRSAEEVRPWPPVAPGISVEKAPL